MKDIGEDDIKGITKDNEWFTEHIIVQDKNVTIKLNGKEVVKWTQPADWNGGREGSGRVIGTARSHFKDTIRTAPCTTRTSVSSRCPRNARGL